MNKTSQELEIGGKKLTLETGQLAIQSTSAVLAKIGDTMVLATVVKGRVREDIDYFPLSVDYIERLYAGGRIKGSRWVKREGRPSDDAILAGRLIDRSIRPLFPKAFKNEVQIIVTVLSVDNENDADILAINAVSAALAISGIPWNGPIGAVRMGYVKENGDKGELLTNPSASEGDLSELDIVVSQLKDKTVMLEASALQVREDVLYGSIEKAHKETEQIIKLIEDFAKKAGKKKLEVPDEVVLDQAKSLVEKTYKEEILSLIESKASKESDDSSIEDLVSKIVEDEKNKNPETEIDKKIVAKAVEAVMYKIIKLNVVEKKKRVDGRKLDEIREISASVGILPRTHGSAIFQRGITQALSIATLGSPRMEQLIESAEGEESKRYIHHYSGLPYSFGQTGRVGTPSRREIGHGALAERALIPVIPSQDEFPYTIRVVSEVLSQNGSSSMASTCGSTLALMDAGVPIKKPVAGISIGMMSVGDKYELITDIIGLEDFSGDMDFKVAGTDEGVTAIQLDVKIPGLTLQQIKEILEMARVARLQILEMILKVLPQSREALSQYAPKIEVVKIPVEKIGEIIGPGGRVIKNIIAQTGATVDVEDDGMVTISGTTEESVKKAVEWVSGLTREVKPGEEFEGEVKRILPFGAFIEYMPGREGMVHVSQMASGFVKNPNDVVSLGQKVKIRVVEIDEQGRVNLSMLFGEDQNKRREFQSPTHSSSEHPLSKQFRRERAGQRPNLRRGRFRPNR